MCAAPSRLSRLPSFFDDSLAPFDDGCGPGLPHRRRPVCELGSEFGVSARSTTEIDGMHRHAKQYVHIVTRERRRFTAQVGHALAMESAACPRPSYHPMVNDFRRSIYIYIYTYIYIYMSAQYNPKKMVECFHGLLFSHLWTLPRLFWFETES